MSKIILCGYAVHSSNPYMLYVLYGFHDEWFNILKLKG